MPHPKCFIHNCTHSQLLIHNSSFTSSHTQFLIRNSLLELVIRKFLIHNSSFANG